MPLDLDREPFLSLRTLREDDDGNAFASELERARYWSGLEDNDLVALGLIASWTGQLEQALSELLICLIQADRDVAHLLTKNLMASSLIDSVKAIFALQRWQAFADEHETSLLLIEVKEVFQLRNAYLHGGVNGSAIDETYFAYSKRRSPQDEFGGPVELRENLTKLAARTASVSDAVFGLWAAAETESRARLMVSGNAVGSDEQV